MTIPTSEPFTDLGLDSLNISIPELHATGERSIGASGNG